MGPIDLRLSHLRAFLLLVETRNYRAAALRMFRSQPAFSQAIQQLELRLGAPLFEPGARTTLTPFGERCLPLIREAVGRMERAVTECRRMADASGGRVAIAILPSVAQEWLPWLLREFGAAYPGVEVRVSAEDSVNVQRLVAEGEVDFGITSSPSPDPKLAFEPLIRDRFGLLCRTDHRYARQKALAWDRLADEPILGSTMHRMLQGTAVGPLVERPRIHVSNLPTLIALVKAGAGVLPMPALAYPVGEPELAFVPLVRPVEMRTIGIVTLKGRSPLPSARALIELLRAGLGRSERKRHGRHQSLAHMMGLPAGAAGRTPMAGSRAASS